MAPSRERTTIPSALQHNRRFIPWLPLRLVAKQSYSPLASDQILPLKSPSEGHGVVDGIGSGVALKLDKHDLVAAEASNTPDPPTRNQRRTARLATVLFAPDVCRIPVL